MIKGVVFVAIFGIVAGTLGTFGTILNQAGFTGFQVASIRVLITCLTLLAFYPLFFRGSFTLMKQNWKLLLPHSIAGVFGFNMCFFIATEYLGITLAVALLYTAPIWVMILAKVFLGEQSNMTRWVLVLCSVLGVVLILNTQDQELNFSFIGVLIGFGSAIGYAIYAVLGKTALTKLSANQLMFSAFTFSIPLVLLFPQTWQGLGQVMQSTDIYVFGAFLAVSWLGTILINFFYMRGLKLISASSATVITTIEPLVATMLAVFVIGEILSLSQYAGMALIIICATLIGLLEAKASRQSNTVF